ncbi:MAG: 30S ribosomal protein S17 [Bacteroidota bacterium]
MEPKDAVNPEEGTPEATAPEEAMPEAEAPEATPAAEAAAPEAAAPGVAAEAPVAVAAPAAEPVAEEAPKGRNARKERIGLVVSDKMDKTITVAVQRQVKHPIYGKIIKKTTKLKAHDATNNAGEGDTVRIRETRPMSKTKRWMLVEILERRR